MSIEKFCEKKKFAYRFSKMETPVWENDVPTGLPVPKIPKLRSEVPGAAARLRGAVERGLRPEAPERRKRRAEAPAGGGRRGGAVGGERRRRSALTCDQGWVRGMVRSA